MAKVWPIVGDGNLSAVEQADLSTLNEGQSIEYEVENNRGKESAVKLKSSDRSLTAPGQALTAY